ncbi:hypothetical protein BST36_11285 [Mycolicibacterium moriokaense]|uniref:Integrase n=1 Tax=Mycolicibacterium moriokaense TaxID=39691 RepID=A0AAD1M7H9_9MYCO|nr:hypothetical protein [Mycolicibacterium moriokaense]MCV7038344.1 hypothetical protein [Mycolicibacterium moriokaense]ORB24315.1 hypothetical protein BST36_11285 [Mycolicibacterium moriokaense]BBX02535.1 hypothetical protein MMOR_34710 [Mycolicibacterium moriokaense]
MLKPFHSRAAAAMVAGGLCALVVSAPPAGADNEPVPTQDNAVYAIADGYIAKQNACTPELTPFFESITWDPPGFTPEGGTGMIHDANDALGGQFAATWNGQSWDVEYQFC